VVIVLRFGGGVVRLEEDEMVAGLKVEGKGRGDRQR
jgi:hypothetical protein